MEDVLDVYQLPYDATRPVVCLDESNKVLHKHKITPMETTVHNHAIQRPDYTYEAQGSANMFMISEPLRGWRRVTVTDNRTGYEMAEQLRRLVEEDYPDAQRIVLVTDNLNTHHTGVLYERFEPQVARKIARKLEWHYTPKHGSWLNMAEIELSTLQRQCLSRRIGDSDTLQAQVNEWAHSRNSACSSITWRFTTPDARIKLKRLYPIVNL